MTKILPIRGSNTEINNTPIIDGQLLFEINSSNGQNHIYMDVEKESEFITDSPYYINNTGICMTLNVSSILPYIDINKINNGEAYMALINHSFQYDTPMFISTNPDAVIFRFIPTQTSGEGTGGDIYSYSTTCEYNGVTWYISHAANIQHSSVLSCIPNNIRLNFAGSDWSEIGYYFLQSIYENANSQNSMIPARIPIGLNDWSQIVDKPFSSIGVGLNVINGVLSLSSPLNVTWDDINNKLFDDIGSGLSVSQNELSADVRHIMFAWRAGTASANYAKYQQITITNKDGYYTQQINDTKYMEYSQTLNTNSNTVYTFTSSDDITLNGAIDVFTSIYGFKPISIVAANGVCTVTFPPYDTANTSMTCRIYIKDKQYE